MNMRLTIGDWPMQQAHAQAVRHEVFVLEQNIPIEMEWDAMDAVCVHAVAYDDNEQAIGTGRLLPDGHIGRMAVRKAARSRGVGGGILKALMQAAKARGDHVVRLNAQTSAEAFYLRHGFVRHGEPFFEAGIPHIRMEYLFT
jgi:predicted GNAT family N-acyltransferase